MHNRVQLKFKCLKIKKLDKKTISQMLPDPLANENYSQEF